MPEGTELAAPRRWAPMDAIGSGEGGKHEAPAAPTRSLQMLWALLQGPVAGSFA